MQEGSVLPHPTLGFEASSVVCVRLPNAIEKPPRELLIERHRGHIIELATKVAKAELLRDAINGIRLTANDVGLPFSQVDWTFAALLVIPCENIRPLNANSWVERLRADGVNIKPP